MNELFRKIPLLAKLLLIAIVPLLFAAYLTAELHKEKTINLSQTKTELEGIEESATVTRLIDQLQVEREFSFDYVLRGLKKEEMVFSRMRTDSLLQVLKNNYPQSTGKASEYAFLDNLDSVRSKIEEGIYKPNQVMHVYSTAVFRFSSLNPAPAMHGNYSDVEKELEMQRIISEILTYRGIIAANIYNILFSRQYVVETLLGTLPTYDVLKLQVKQLEGMASHASMQSYFHLKNGSRQKSFNQYLHRVFTSFKVDSSYSYEQWKELANASQNELRRLQLNVLSNAEKNIRQFYEKEKRARNLTLIALALVTLIIIFITLYILYSVNRSLQEIRKGALQLAEGQSDIMIGIHSNDAIGSLASSIREIDEKNKSIARAASEIGNGNFNVAIKPRSTHDVLVNAIVQMKDSLLGYTNDLKKSREEFKKLADFMPQIVWISNAEGKVEYYNKQWFQTTGIPEGTKEISWVGHLHPDDVGRVLTSWYETIETGKNFEIEYRLKNFQTSNYRWMLGRAVPVKDENGGIIKWFGTATDIHDKKIQNQQLEEIVALRTLELHRSNEDLQQFAHVASHDLKEPLRKIRTFSNRLSEEYGNEVPEKARIYMQKLEHSAERMSSMIEGILNYSMVNTSVKTVEIVDLNKVMDGVLSDLELLIIQKEAEVIYDDLPKIKGTPALISQLFYNLVNNALKFSRKNASPVIHITSSTMTPQEIDKMDLPRGRKYLKIVVKDNGIGFSQEYADKIFNVFTRLHTRENYEGTGLGLALCKKIVQRHEGYVVAEGKEQEGACFTVVFPA